MTPDPLHCNNSSRNTTNSSENVEARGKRIRLDTMTSDKTFAAEFVNCSRIAYSAAGLLYTVATPIGNLSDITYRAVEVLKSVDLIVAEDTRHSKVLLDKYGITKPLESFHAHSDDSKLDLLIRKLLAGENLALISDAGTPGISDPGFRLISKAVELGVKVIPIPGASAFLTGLQAAGLPTDKFIYLGFLPIKKGRQTLFKKIAEEEKTIVFYESPHRIQKTLSQIAEFMPGRYISVARELTKIYEEFIAGPVEEVAKKVKPKGEFVVMIAPKDFKKFNR
ncbi:MAG: 16S rRNA methyltransferase [Candidatus Peregrinibacteria bacterium GW2011_GWF2_43_17]|nr:MAG: 16S rRNA methyltransferase [Candidatus Peregrinibacteria bacterium GW2011_GWF2_43_17]KKT20592.1 MAG: Ribosomal RNA small subunit methyltransferase I [Candidatus Peregrinibacteria bacterium GW2011_GWA2_43_8]